MNIYINRDDFTTRGAIGSRVLEDRGYLPQCFYSPHDIHTIPFNDSRKAKVVPQVDKISNSFFPEEKVEVNWQQSNGPSATSDSLSSTMVPFIDQSVDTKHLCATLLAPTADQLWNESVHGQESTSMVTTYSIHNRYHAFPGNIRFRMPVTEAAAVKSYAACLMAHPCQTLQHTSTSPVVLESYPCKRLRYHDGEGWIRTTCNRVPPGAASRISIENLIV